MGGFKRNNTQLPNRAWINRALNPETPTTEAKETVKTRSSEVNGQEILYPTIRMINGHLKKLGDQEALEIALEKKDFIKFNSPNEANNFSKYLSDLINRRRK